MTGLKLNADIIFDSLSDTFNVRKYGRHVKHLNLDRPILYPGKGREFEENSLTIAPAESLPPNPIFRDGAVVICVGAAAPVVYLSGTCPCLVVEGGDLVSVCNAVQRIFNRFDEWDREMWNVLMTSADLNRLIEISYPIFENPIVVIDADFRYLAYSSIIDQRDDMNLIRPDENNLFQKQYISESFRQTTYDMSKREPFLIVYDGKTHYSINLFRDNNYIGNLKIAFIKRPFRTGDGALCQHFAEIVEKTVARWKTLTSGEFRSAERIYRALLDGNPLTNVDRQTILAQSSRSYFHCAKIIRGNRARKKVPIEYFKEQLENTFAGSVVFEYESSIVAFMPSGEGNFRTQQFAEFLRKMDLTVGISNAYSLEKSGQIRYFYRQASIALEFGLANHPNERIFSFRDYMFTYMVLNALGEFPASLIDCIGFHKLVEFNKTAQVDYVETLHVYLENERNISQTAKALYIHRSTLIERLERIKSILQADLDDPKLRTELYLIENAYRIQKDMTTSPTETDRWAEENPPSAGFLQTEFKNVENIL